MTGQPRIEVRPGDRALFASDMHLGEHDPATAELFLERLHSQAPGATHLFLLGDLFEAWVGDDWADAVCERAIRALAGVSRGGCRIHVMRGNRDFLLDVPLPQSPAPSSAGFAARIGATMLQDPCVISLFGEPALLAHGDALCTDDGDYQRFRALTRDPSWQRAFLEKPLGERIAIAQDLRARSELSKTAKADYIMDVNAGAVESAMRTAGVRLLIHGHTHRPARHQVALDGAPALRIVLPDWDAAQGRGGMLAVTAEGIADA
jgi:UDP-2,3-diacylglucosamine hydrolase